MGSLPPYIKIKIVVFFSLYNIHVLMPLFLFEKKASVEWDHFTVGRKPECEKNCQIFALYKKFLSFFYCYKFQDQFLVKKMKLLILIGIVFTLRIMLMNGFRPGQFLNFWFCD